MVVLSPCDFACTLPILVFFVSCEAVSVLLKVLLGFLFVLVRPVCKEANLTHSRLSHDPGDAFTLLVCPIGTLTDKRGAQNSEKRLQTTRDAMHVFVSNKRTPH